MQRLWTICILLAAIAHVRSKQLPVNTRTAADTPDKYDLDTTMLPENTAVVENTEVTLRCAVANPSDVHSIQWWEYVYNEQGSIISDNLNIGSHPERDRYTIIQGHSAEYSLRISPVLMRDGGLYQCLDSWGLPAGKQRHSLHLTVTAIRPNCTTTLPDTGIVLEHQYHTNECTLNYKGGIIPNMTWSGIGPFTQAYTATDSLIWAGMQYTATRNMDTRSHLSDMFFTPYFLPVDGDASNVVPNMTYTHRERQMFVYWGPSGIVVDPLKDNYEVGDVINCTADAFPPATFTWMNLRTAAVIAGSIIVVEEEWLDKVTPLRCEARNNAGGSLHTANYFFNASVPSPTTTTTPTTTPPSTLPPAVSRCGELTGAWESQFPGRASLCIKLDLERGGYITGLARNATDTWWVDW